MISAAIYDAFGAPVKTLGRGFGTLDGLHSVLFIAHACAPVRWHWSTVHGPVHVAYLEVRAKCHETGTLFMASLFALLKGERAWKVLCS